MNSRKRLHGSPRVADGLSRRWTRVLTIVPAILPVCLQSSADFRTSHAGSCTPESNRYNVASCVDIPLPGVFGRNAQRVVDGKVALLGISRGRRHFTPTL